MSATAGSGTGVGMLGRYRLCSELGRGGMGVVHLAVDERGRAVAVKVLREHVLDDPEARARLAREVEHLSRIRHPGVAGVLDADVHGPRPYVVTRYVPGPSLERYVATHGPLPPEELLALARDLSDALTAVHAAGVVHRDLKPANVLLHEGRPVLIDFGIAHSAGDSRLTSTGLVMGTPGFLAPEVLDGAPVTAATDWWAWAATLAFAATARVPFGDGPVGAVLARIRAGECDLRGVDPALAPLLRAALGPDPRVRPTQRDILAELARRAAVGPATAALPAPVTQIIPAVPATAPVPAASSAPVAPSVPPAPSEGWVRPDPEARAWPPPQGGPVAGPSPRAPRGGGGPGARPGERDMVVGAAGIAAPAPPRRLPRRTGLVVCLGLFVCACAVVAPALTALGALAWSALARTVDRAVVGLALRRGESGARRGDVAAAVLRSPAYAVGALLGACVAGVLPTLVGASGVVGGIALQGMGVLPGLPQDPSAPAPLLAGALGALVVAWWGPGGSGLRRGTRVLARAASPGRYGAVVAGAMLLVSAIVLGLVSQSSGFVVDWSPLGGDPFAWMRGLSAAL